MIDLNLPCGCVYLYDPDPKVEVSQRTRYCTEHKNQLPDQGMLTELQDQVDKFLTAKQAGL